jgi:hypothetical protein
VCLWASLWFSPPTWAGEYGFYSDPDRIPSPFEKNLSTEDGGSNPAEWGRILSLSGKIIADRAIFTVTKRDNSSFKEDGTMYLKVQGTEHENCLSEATNKTTVNYKKDDFYVTLTVGLKQGNTKENPYPKAFCAYLSTGRAWVGPLKIHYRLDKPSSVSKELKQGDSVVKLSWGSSSDANTYRVVLSKDPAFKRF